LKLPPVPLVPAFGLALLIEGVGDRKSIRIQFNDAVNCWTRLVDLLDAGGIFLHQRVAGELAGLHSILQLRDGDFIEFKRLDLHPEIARRPGRGVTCGAKGRIEGREGCSRSAEERGLEK